VWLWTWLRRNFLRDWFLCFSFISADAHSLFQNETKNQKPKKKKKKKKNTHAETACAGVTCPSGSLCTLKDGGYFCDYCFNTPCENGGSCISLESSFECKCPFGYVDESCSIGIFFFFFLSPFFSLQNIFLPFSPFRGQLRFFFPRTNHLPKYWNYVQSSACRKLPKSWANHLLWTAVFPKLLPRGLLWRIEELFFLSKMWRITMLCLWGPM